MHKAAYLVTFSRRRKRRKLAETITLSDSSESGDEKGMRRTENGGSNSATSTSAAAFTTDDPDCLRLQDSRVLFSSSDDDDDDDDVAPGRRRRSDTEMAGNSNANASSVAQRSFERIVDSLPENLRTNWTWLRQRRVCFRQLEFGHCKYKDKYVCRLTVYKYVSLQEWLSYLAWRLNLTVSIPGPRKIGCATSLTPASRQKT